MISGHSLWHLLEKRLVLGTWMGQELGDHLPRMSWMYAVIFRGGDKQRGRIREVIIDHLIR